ncbi:MAG: hypothetical protein FJY97_00260 [candidate division Zixibacteria bacterium]|nr:hypothetical protein [candidate division Zixibacteria bacterium]
MRSLLGLFTGLALVSGTACSSSPETPPETSALPAALQTAPAESTVAAPDTTPAPVASAEDTMPRPASTIQTPSAPPASTLASAPGTFRARVTLLTTEETTDGFLVILRIDTVTGRGASTPPLAAGNEIRARIEKSVDRAETLGRAGLSAETTLRYQKLMTTVQPPPPSWQVVVIH